MNFFVVPQEQLKLIYFNIQYPPDRFRFQS